MKRIALIGLTFAVASAVGACGSSDDSPVGTDSGNPAVVDTGGDTLVQDTVAVSATG